MKLTPWFPPKIKPVHVGVYQREHCEPDQARFAYWNGRYWCLWGFDTPDAAMDFGNLYTRAIVRHARWRGLAEKP